MRLLILVFFSTVLSCNKYTCPAVVEANKKEYQQYMKTVSDYEEEGKNILIENYREAIIFLSLVTGINSKADYSSTFGYRNKSDYKNDMEHWGKWYKKNNCKLTQQYIDSAFKGVGLQK
jgi:hypothetical protein